VLGEKNTPEVLNQILDLGKLMTQKPVELLDGIEEVLDNLYGKYNIILATKGDLFDQERKIKKSGLEKYFDSINVMTEKHKSNYKLILDKLNCDPNEFLMIGNSMKSDILPVLELGANAVYIPFHTTWAYEEIEEEVKHDRLIQIETVKELLPILGR
jgi:putative hydrolase of the HAD superfamily